MYHFENKLLYKYVSDPKIKTKAGQSLIHLATTKQLTDDDFSTLIKIFKKKVK